MTSTEVRQSFLEFFKSKKHTIVPSSSLMPDSPNLLFTNAGMNQFVPIFLGQRPADVDKWSGVVPALSTRACDTQKCIRAGGKHNDLDDVGLDTYHHTFFEMLGNWSFGDYFKKEAIEWAWELITVVWKFPKNRLYATVYKPGPGDPSEFDHEAYGIWEKLFSDAGLDPKVHIVYGNKKDNFWMMGETGPCGPCSELHVDLTPAGDTNGALVNKGRAECIEIWNLVFMQFNANPDGTFVPLPAKNVDTGMGFERVTGIMQNTNGFKDFTRIISNYETDIFRPIFDKIEQLSGKHYASTLPKPGSTGDTEQEKIDVAFRVIGDHIRTLSFSIADGIVPGNNDRNYVLRRILRRAVRYGRTLGFKEPFFYKLVDVLAEKMGDIFPEIRAKQSHVKEVIQAEEESFNKTLDNGTEIFEGGVIELTSIRTFLQNCPANLASFKNELVNIADSFPIRTQDTESLWANFLSETNAFTNDFESSIIDGKSNARLATFRYIRSEFCKKVENLCAPINELMAALRNVAHSPQGFEGCRGGILERLEKTNRGLGDLIPSTFVIPGELAFKLYDTYGFPLDLTQLMARERGLTVDVDGFNKLMDEQRARARAAQKKQIISLSSIDTSNPTKFVGYDKSSASATVLEVVDIKGKTAVTLDISPLYAEMGGQVGDAGEILANGKIWCVVNTQKVGHTFLHFLAEKDAPEAGSKVELRIDLQRRNAIQRHHTVTHLLHWALHEVVNKDASQKGSYVGPEKLTFDFASAALTPAQVSDVEKLVNERILENAPVTWSELPYSEVKQNKAITQMFGEKYGDVVRVVQIGGRAAAIDGYSMELCGGTHVRATGEIGLFRILSESATAAGVRRIEAVAGLRAYEKSKQDESLILTVASKVNSPVGELEKKVEAILAQQKELEKQLKAFQQKQAAELARALVAKAQTANGVSFVIENLGAVDGDFLQSVADSIKGIFKGVVVLGGSAHDAVSLIATVSSDFTSKFQAGKLIQAIAPIVGGKGGGKPENARGGGKDVAKLDEALAKAKALLGN